ncbi:DUF2231 domain-containing protein [Ahrensia sp. 13_GOM-1096m]|uniref:DUF2231 domain-containing protein n=1 Tax=Ahrensia sp. 13_GOM-1096m TaxID=1380380 RepID=UPI0009DFF70F|nr:DUF2231 domain-containing protein [Ahrensia sp. 13_GOM-1096m]
MTDASQDQEKIELEQEETPPEARDNHPNPAIRAVAEKDIGSAIAVAGHPIHAMMVHFPIALVVSTLGVDVFYWWTGDAFWMRVGVWSAGAAFAFGVLAAIVGTIELLAVPGIRVRVASWNHAVAAMVLVAISGANAGLRLFAPELILPNGLIMSALASMAAGFAGWHGGKLVFDHGVGLLISPRQ